MANILLPLKSLCAIFPIANRQSISCSEFKLYVPAIFVGSNELLNCNLPARRQLDGVVRTYWSQSGGQLLKFCQVTERIACYCGKKWWGLKWAAGRLLSWSPVQLLVLHQRLLRVLNFYLGSAIVSSD